MWMEGSIIIFSPFLKFAICWACSSKVKFSGKCTISTNCKMDRFPHYVTKFKISTRYWYDSETKKIFLIKNRQLTITEIILTSNSSLVPRLLRQVLGYTSAIVSLMYCKALSWVPISPWSRNELSYQSLTLNRDGGTDLKSEKYDRLFSKLQNLHCGQRFFS